MKEISQRKNIRLKGYDYSKEGLYFITICIKNRECILSEIKKCRGVHCTSFLTNIGNLVDKYINNIEDIYANVLVDEYIIMPNHIHMILEIKEKCNNSIPQIIQSFKGVVTKELKYSIWQKLFYEHIIRDEREYLKIKEYIINNPYNWDNDMYH